jgi:hypothetical protein
MLGADTPLPGDCRLGNASIEGGGVIAHYDCAGGPVTLELRHPADAGSNVRPDAFSIVARGSVPPALLEAVAQRIADHQGQLQWVDESGAPRPTTGQPRLRRPLGQSAGGVKRPPACSLSWC